MNSRVNARLWPLVLALAGACRASAPGSEPAGGGHPTRGVAAVAVPYDVEHYAIALELDPARRTIDASCTIRVWPTAERLSSVDLDFDGLEVESIRDHDGRDLRWSRAEGQLSVELFAPIVRGTCAEFTVLYSGVPERGLFFTRERDGVATEVFTHGECRDARAWFPCRDEPDDRATSEVRVTMPRGWTSVAAGERLERVEEGDRATERWRMTYPHPAYLETLVAGELHVENDEWDGVPLTYVGPRELKENMRTAFAETGAILAFFSELTGVRYPYSKYAQACVDNFPFGGMENISATTMTDTMLPDEQGLADGSSIELVAHEAAHQWFGNLLTCRDWSHAWLNEGLATYMTALYTERTRGIEAFRREMRGIRDAYLARDVGTNRRPIVYGVAEDPLELFFSGHVYQGAAIRLHHLRAVLGDDVFFRGIQCYVASNRGRGVVTDDLRVAMEQVSGRDLRSFFEQWFRRPGFPMVEASWTYDETKRVVRLALEQTQDPTSGTPAVFALPIDVEVRTQEGSKLEHVELDARSKTFELACAARPEYVLVDPFDLVPMKLNERMTVSQWFDVVDASDANGRVRALGVIARALPDSTSDLEAFYMLGCLLLHAQTDACAEARLIGTRGLENVQRGVYMGPLPLGSGARKSAGPPQKRGRHVGALIELACKDPDLEVRIAAYESLRQVGPDSELALFAGDELRRAEGWRLRGAIASLRARAAPATAFEFLVRELETRSAHGTYEARILTELAATRDPRATPILVSWVRDAEKPDAARAVAVRELAREAISIEGRSAVIELLRSPRVRLRREAIQALGALRDPASRAALENHARSARIPSERRAAEALLVRPVSDA